MKFALALSVAVAASTVPAIAAPSPTREGSHMEKRLFNFFGSSKPVSTAPLPSDTDPEHTWSTVIETSDASRKCQKAIAAAEEDDNYEICRPFFAPYERLRSPAICEYHIPCIDYARTNQVLLSEACQVGTVSKNLSKDEKKVIHDITAERNLQKVNNLCEKTSNGKKYCNAKYESEAKDLHVGATDAQIEEHLKNACSGECTESRLAQIKYVMKMNENNNKNPAAFDTNDLCGSYASKMAAEVEEPIAEDPLATDAPTSTDEFFDASDADLPPLAQETPDVPVVADFGVPTATTPLFEGSSGTIPAVNDAELLPMEGEPLDIVAPTPAPTLEPATIVVDTDATAEAPVEEFTPTAPTSTTVVASATVPGSQVDGADIPEAPAVETPDAEFVGGAAIAVEPFTDDAEPTPTPSATISPATTPTSSTSSTSTTSTTSITSTTSTTSTPAPATPATDVQTAASEPTAADSPSAVVPNISEDENTEQNDDETSTESDNSATDNGASVEGESPESPTTVEDESANEAATAETESDANEDSEPVADDASSAQTDNSENVDSADQESTAEDVDAQNDDAKEESQADAKSPASQESEGKPEVSESLKEDENDDTAAPTVTDDAEEKEAVDAATTESDGQSDETTEGESEAEVEGKSEEERTESEEPQQNDKAAKKAAKNAAKKAAKAEKKAARAAKKAAKEAAKEAAVSQSSEEESTEDQPTEEQTTEEQPAEEQTIQEEQDAQSGSGSQFLSDEEEQEINASLNSPSRVDGLVESTTAPTPTVPTSVPTPAGKFRSSANVQKAGVAWMAAGAAVIAALML